MYVYMYTHMYVYMYTHVRIYVHTHVRIYVHTYVCIYVHVCAQRCLTLCSSMDCSLPSSSVHGIFQASILEPVAISYSRGASWHGDWTYVLHLLHWQADSLPPAPPGKWCTYMYIIFQILSLIDYYKYRVQLPMLHSRSLLVTYFTYSSEYMSIPNS